MKNSSVIQIIGIILLMISSYFFANSIQMDKSGIAMNVLEVNGEIKTSSYPSQENTAFSEAGYIFLLIGTLISIYGVYLVEKE